MGNFTHATTLHSAYDDRTEVVEALVDTGATFSSVPAPVLDRLGVTPHRTVRLRLANGEVEQRAIGHVTVDLNGESDDTICVFRDPDSPAAIGAVTLEVFLPPDDPVEQRLVPITCHSEFRRGIWGGVSSRRELCNKLAIRDTRG